MERSPSARSRKLYKEEYFSDGFSELSSDSWDTPSMAKKKSRKKKQKKEKDKKSEETRRYTILEMKSQKEIDRKQVLMPDIPVHRDRDLDNEWNQWREEARRLRRFRRIKSAAAETSRYAHGESGDRKSGGKNSPQHLGYSATENSRSWSFTRIIDTLFI